MLLANNCNSICILLLAAVLKLILNVEGADKEVKKERHIHDFTENLQLHRSKREFGTKSNQCENIKDKIIYCPFKYTFQVSAKFKTTQAEVALCKKGFSTCPTKLNTSTVLNGCVYTLGCEYTEQIPSECKVLGASCLGKPGQPTYLKCCNGRISTNGKDKVEVIGQCNTTSNVCEPQFPLNTACGDGSKEYLSCFHNGRINGRCVYPMESTNPTQFLGPKIIRSIKKSKNGTEELGICADSSPCNYDNPVSVNIFCGPKLPVEYENARFCGCVSPDLKTAYQCQPGDTCERCGLLGTSCKSQNCCYKYMCDIEKHVCINKPADR